MYEYIKINGQDVPRPPEFAPQKEDVYAGELVTQSYRTVADKVGWKFSDMELSWDALPQSYINILNSMSGLSTIEFDDTSGMVTEQIRRSSIVQMRHRYTVNGEYWWRDVSCKIEFINAHRGI